jgi:acetyl-CoA carboxylase carboxyltransferase component
VLDARFGYSSGASWQDEIDGLERRRALARRMGGPENVERQHKAGRLTVRERIDQLLDADSFQETGGLAGKATYVDGKLENFLPANSVGIGRVAGRRVVVCGDDFTVRGGAADAAIHAKQVYGSRSSSAGSSAWPAPVTGTSRR